MALDTNSVSQLIADFRMMKAKDSITPESVGYILQRLADLIATAGSSETVAQIKTLIDSYKRAGQAITNFRQVITDLEKVIVEVTTIDLVSGGVTSHPQVLMLPATTEQAGSMTASQVADLEAAKADISEIRAVMEGEDSPLQKGTLYPISCTVENGRIRIHGHSKLVAKGYVPYLFRYTRKRNPFHDKWHPGLKKYCSKRKGWNLYGSMKSVTMHGDWLYFSLNEKKQLTSDATAWGDAPEALISITESVAKNGDPIKFVAWGRSRVAMADLRNENKPRMLRLRFAVGFGKPVTSRRVRVTPASLVTNLAEFSIVYSGVNDTPWTFGK